MSVTALKGEKFQFFFYMDVGVRINLTQLNKRQILYLEA